MWWHFFIQTSLLKIGCLVHKLGFVGTEVVGTVINLRQQELAQHLMSFLLGFQGKCT